MAQIFHRSTNTISGFTIYGFVFVLAALSWALYIWQGSYWFNRMGEVEEQPVPFSHAHHAGGLGIDCRYCHTSVETSSFAGIPPTKTCMNCHSGTLDETASARGIKGFSGILEAAARTPLRRNTDPAEVADAAVFLASGLARGVTGNVLFVDSEMQIVREQHD